jgi:glycosyltransferase involved in cell wall biosynthesis
VIPNPLPLEHWRGGKAIKAGARAHHEIVAAGRLVPQKGFDILIESFGRISSCYPDWTLTIYGEGPQRPELEIAVSKHELRDKVALPGVANDMRPVFRRASLFVLPSRLEGYPNVLLEALACGCPVIATDCPGGCGEILAQGRYGVLVPNESIECLAIGLKEMIENPELRASYSARAEGALKALDLETIANKWIKIFAETQRNK